MVHDWILEGLPQSLHQKHFKLIENESNTGSVFSQPPTTTNSKSNAISSYSSQLSLGESQKQNENTGNRTSVESYSYASITNNMPNSIATSIQLNKAQGAFLINGQYPSGSSKERKKDSKEKDTSKPSQNSLQVLNNFQQQQQQPTQHYNHYIPKEYKGIGNNKRLSKRSINLNFKSETIYEDESIIDMTINLTGARTLHTNKSIEVKHFNSKKNSIDETNQGWKYDPPLLKGTLGRINGPPLGEGVIFPPLKQIVLFNKTKWFTYYLFKINQLIGLL